MFNFLEWADEKLFKKTFKIPQQPFSVECPAAGQHFQVGKEMINGFKIQLKRTTVDSIAFYPNELD